MDKKKEKKVVLKDSENVRNIIIQVDMKKGATSVISSFSAWENLALIMEALGATATQCIKEGMEKKHVYKTIEKYVMQVLTSYH